MPEARYEVVTKGIMDGENSEEVRARLAKLIKNKNVNLDPIIDKAELVVKKNLDLESAKKYRDGFHRAGVICELRRQDDILEAMVCPNCGFRQPKAEACIRCGIMIEKYKGGHKTEVGSEEDRANPGAGEKETWSREGILSKLSDIWSLRGGPVAIILIALFVAYSIFEAIWLRGDLVASRTLTITGPNNFVQFRVKKPSQEYLIRIRTRKKRKLSVRLVDTKGTVYYKDNEYASHKTRSFAFKPPSSGTYRVYVESGPLSFTTYARASVSVYTNDRRVLTKILDRFKI